MYRVPPSPRHAPAVTLFRPAPRLIDLRRARRLHHLERVSMHATAGAVLPLIVIQLGHYAFGWNSLAVLVGGLD